LQEIEEDAMPFIHKSNGENGLEAGTFIKLNWGVLLGIIVASSLGIFGIIDASNKTDHIDLGTKIEKTVNAVGSLSTVVNGNCSDIAVLKAESAATKSMFDKLDLKLDSIRKDQLDFYMRSGFKVKSGSDRSER
jgi:hypothetical protein